MIKAFGLFNFLRKKLKPENICTKLSRKQHGCCSVIELVSYNKMCLILLKKKKN